MMATIVFIGLLTTALAEFCLASFVFYRSPVSNYHRLAAGRSLSIGLFALFSIFFYFASSYETAALWNKIRTVPYIFFPALTFLFAWYWTQKKKDKYSRTLSGLLIGSLLLFQAANFFVNILGYPAHSAYIAWVTITASDPFWPLLFSAWAITLLIFTIILSIYYYFNIKDAVERKNQFPILLGNPVTALPAIFIGLLPASFLPDFLIYLPVWMLASDILIAIGLTSKKIFVLSFSSAFYPVIQSMSEAAALVDLDFSICAANAAFCRLVEKSESELIGRPLSQPFQQDYFTIDQSIKYNTQPGNSRSTLELVTKNGKKITASPALIPIYNNGQQRGTAILIADISFQKIAEDQLQSLKTDIGREFEEKAQYIKGANEKLEAELAQLRLEEGHWRQKVIEFESLANLSTQLRSARSIQSLLSILLRETAHILGADAGVIFLRTGNGLVVKSLYGVPNDYNDYHYPSNRDYLWMALESGQPVFLNAKEKNPATEFPVFLPGMGSAVICPLKTSEKQIGLLVLGFRIKSSFHSKDHEFLESIGNLTSNALYRSSTMESLEQRVSTSTRELETLHRVASIPNEPNTSLNQTLLILLETLKVKVGVIYLDGGDDDVLVSIQPIEYPEEIKAELKAIPIEMSLWGLIYRSEQPLLVRNMEEDSRIDIGIVTELMTLGNCTLIAAPIRGSGPILGAVCLFKDPKYPFLPEDLALLSTVTHQIGTTIEINQLKNLNERNIGASTFQQLANELPESISKLLSTQYQVTETSLQSIRDGDLASASSYLEKISQTSHQALKEIQLLNHVLRPAPLEKLGLYAALQHRLETVEQKAHIKTCLSGEYRFRLPGNMEENLYRVSQEALNLLIKNSQTTEVEVHLASDYDSIVVEINCKDFGFDQIGENAVADLREEVEAIGGKLIIDSGPDKRMTLQIKV